MDVTDGWSKREYDVVKKRRIAYMISMIIQMTGQIPTDGIIYS